mgnify:CR=1 FL=1
MTPFVARVAANPIAYLGLSIVVAAIGATALGIVAAVSRRKVVLLALPIVFAPLGLWLHEWKTDHGWFRAALLEHGARGTLAIYGTDFSGEVVNERRVMDLLAMIQPASGPARKVRFHDFFALSCQAGEMPTGLVQGPVYAVRFDPDAPDRFCVDQTADAIARDAECPALARDVAEQARRVRLAPADAAARQALTALEAQQAARCTPHP